MGRDIRGQRRGIQRVGRKMHFIFWPVREEFRYAPEVNDMASPGDRQEKYSLFFIRLLVRVQPIRWTDLLERREGGRPRHTAHLDGHWPADTVRRVGCRTFQYEQDPHEPADFIEVLVRPHVELFLLEGVRYVQDPGPQLLVAVGAQRDADVDLPGGGALLHRDLAGPDLHVDLPIRGTVNDHDLDQHIAQGSDLVFSQLDDRLRPLEGRLGKRGRRPRRCLLGNVTGVVRGHLRACWHH
mmetsp:Transcript_108444/g.306664  ORF Transcript_108444/g.306664 Transcript_108444/m.306664 type:complete len:240 (-) Transcript_108444:257-976(-)